MLTWVLSVDKGTVMEYAVRKQNGLESEGVGYGETYAARKSGRQTGSAVYIYAARKQKDRMG